MPRLLKIDSSPSGSTSFTRELTSEFVKHWKAVNPDGRVIERDLYGMPIAEVTADWIAAVHAPGTSAPDVLKLSDELIADLMEADEYVFGVPMHNFSIPAKLKLWLDQVVRFGATFAYGENGPRGLLVGKKATFLVASGGVYEFDSAMASFDFVRPYLQKLFGFLGVTNCTFVQAGGTSQQRHGVDRSTLIQPALDAVRTRFQTV